MPAFLLTKVPTAVPVNETTSEPTTPRGFRSTGQGRAGCTVKGLIAGSDAGNSQCFLGHRLHCNCGGGCREIVYVGFEYGGDAEASTDRRGGVVVVKLATPLVGDAVPSVLVPSLKVTVPLGGTPPVTA